MKEITKELSLFIIFQLPISILLAYILDKILADPRWFPHPVVFMGKLISFLEKLIRKVAKTPKALKIWGLVLWLGTVLTTYAITYILIKITFSLNFYLGFTIQTVLIWTGIAKQTLANEAKKVYDFVKGKKLQQARKQVGYLVGRDTSKLTYEEITRATVKTVAENTIDGVTAPLMYAMIGGAPLMMAYKAINTLDSMVGYMNDDYRDLGFFSAKIDDIANFIPARVSVIGFIFGAAIKGYDYQEVRRIVMRDKRNHKSPNAGYPESAMAGALGIQLGGSNIYFGKVVEKPTIGDKLREIEADDILRSSQIMKKTSDTMLFMYVLILITILMRTYGISIWG